MIGTKKELLIVIARLLGFLVVDGVFFSVTDPLRLPSIMIVVGFGLLFGTLYEVIRLLLTLLRSWWPLGAARIRRIGALVSGLAVALVAMQSIGQLTTKDLAALVPLIIVLYFYVSYNARRTPHER